MSDEEDRLRVQVEHLKEALEEQRRIVIRLQSEVDRLRSLCDAQDRHVPKCKNCGGPHHAFEC